MKNIFIAIIMIATSMQLKAQFIKEKSVNIAIGYGLSAPFDENVDVIGTGFYIQGEYILSVNKWVDIRPYAGLVLTKKNPSDYEENEIEYKATTKAFLIGAKTRLTAPIPWVAPYVEVGVGASIGTFETFTPTTNIDNTGLQVHIPVSIGFELGPKHAVDIAFTYYFQPSAEQFAGATAVGITIPLN